MTTLMSSSNFNIAQDLFVFPPIFVPDSVKFDLKSVCRQLPYRFPWVSEILKDAYDLCEQEGFVQYCLENSQRRDIILPVLPRGGERCQSVDEYLNEATGTLSAANETRKDVIPDALLNRVKNQIPKKFPQASYPGLGPDKTSAVALMSLAVLYWLVDRGRADLGVIYYPPASRSS